MQIITSMELLTLLNKTKQSIHNLTGSEFRILSYLITCSNHSHGDGYKCWPSQATIQEYTGSTKNTVISTIKRLVEDGWITYVRGKSQNNSSRYYIEGKKVVECYLQSDNSNKAPLGMIAITKVDGKVSNTEIGNHQRNTSGLKQNRKKESPTTKKVISYDELLQEQLGF